MKRLSKESFEPEERRILAAYFTNVDRPVFALVNLPEVVKGALFARYSRSAKSLRRLFLDEFLREPSKFTIPVSTSVGVSRAEELYEKILTDYGDDSVAQLGGVHIACEGVSNVLTKLLEWGRLMAYLEQSTRYVPYTDRPEGRWKYRIPDEIQSPVLRDRYRSVLDGAFKTYASWIDRLQTFFATKHPKEPRDSEAAYRASIRSKALDSLRGLLPAATVSNLGIYGTAQAYENLLLRLRASSLQEAHTYADLILTELNQVIPAFLKRVARPDRGGVWSDYLARTRTSTRNIGSQILSGIEPEPRPEVTLTDFDPDGELKVVAAALFATSQLPEDQILARVRQMSSDERLTVLSAYVGQRENRRHKPGRAFERTEYRFEILTDYGAFRDLQRHRLLTLEWQTLSCDLGYSTPDVIHEAGAFDQWRATMETAADMHAALRDSLGAEVAQYAVPLAYRIRFYMQLNAREAMHVLELRTSPQGHPSYRRVCQEMHRLICERAGHRAIANAMTFVNYQSIGLERLDSEIKSEKKRGGSKPDSY
jgi:thymidylate synthase ThyX